eukprot:3940907-Rhodomonas_salina.1
MSGTDIGYPATSPEISSPPRDTLPGLVTPYAIGLRAPYAISGTDRAVTKSSLKACWVTWGSNSGRGERMLLRARYAMSGTEMPYGPTSLTVDRLVPLSSSGTSLLRTPLSATRAKPGTDEVYGATSGQRAGLCRSGSVCLWCYALATRCPVLTVCCYQELIKVDGQWVTGRDTGTSTRHSCYRCTTSPSTSPYCHALPGTNLTCADRYWPGVCCYAVSGTDLQRATTGEVQLLLCGPVGTSVAPPIALRVC